MPVCLMQEPEWVDMEDSDMQQLTATLMQQDTREFSTSCSAREMLDWFNQSHKLPSIFAVSCTSHTHT